MSHDDAPREGAGGAGGSCETMWGTSTSTILVVSNRAPDHDLNLGFLRQPNTRIVTHRQDEQLLEVVNSQRPLLIIADLDSQPEGAVELFQRLKGNASTAMIPLIVVAPRQFAPEVGRAGADVMVARPLVPQELFEAVKRFVPLPERRHRRYPVNLRFTYIADGRRIQAFSRDLSLRGAFLKTDRLLPPGTQIELNFRLPGQSEEIRCGAVVRATLETDRYHHNGNGIEFSEIRDADLERLEAHLKRHEPRSSLFA